MALIILDPNLDGEAGHHLAYDLAIAREAMARGEAVTIVANRRFEAREIEGVRILPHFTETCYALRHADPVTGAFDDFRHFNDLLQAELAALPRAEFRPGDAVLVPTVTENHLAGLVGWMKSFDPLAAPLFVIHLMMPSGFAVEGDGRQAVEEPLRALFYRLAERAAQGPGPAVHIFASGGQHAAEYGALFGREVPAHPLPLRPEPAARPGAVARRALLFAGDARLDKGLALLPDLATALAAAHPDWTFAAHVNAGNAHGEARAAAARLAEAAEGVANLELAGGRLAPEDYLALLRGVRLALFPYDPELYRRKSSGVLWEAISLGLPVLVPQGTWLEYEARHWGAGHVAYAAHDPAAIAAAFAEALPRIAELEAASASAGERYRAANGPGALMDQVAALWVRHKAAMSLVARPFNQLMDLGRLDAGWHRLENLDGRPARWSGQEPVLAFDWPFDEPWEAEFTLLSYFGAEQLTGASASAGGAPVTLAWTPQRQGGRLLARGAGPGRASPRVELRLRLPFTKRPPNDARDLGVMVGGLRIGPAARDAAARAVPGLPHARVLGPPAPQGGWPVAPALSGEVAAEAGTPCRLAFRIAAATPAGVRGLSLFLGAVPVPLAVTSEPGGAWLATATLPAGLLRGGAVAWDLVQDGITVGEEAPRVLSVVATAMAGTLGPPKVPVPIQSGRTLLRWELCTGIGPEEGPMPDLGLDEGARWILGREACLALEAGAAGTVRLGLRYRSLLPRQSIRFSVNGGAEEVREAPARDIRDAREIAFDLPLREGRNEVRLGFAGVVREPGTGRELALLIERVTLG